MKTYEIKAVFVLTDDTDPLIAINEWLKEIVKKQNPAGEFNSLAEIKTLY